MPDNAFFIAAKCGDHTALALLLTKPFTIDDLNCGLGGACKGGHREIVDLMIKMGATDWNWGLQCACEDDHREIVNLMIKKGVTNWKWAFHQACRYGHRTLVNLMIEKSETDWVYTEQRGACVEVHRELVDILLERGINGWKFLLIKPQRSEIEFFAHLTLHLGKEKRKKFLSTLRERDVDGIILPCLTNKHIVRVHHPPRQLCFTKGKLRAILSQFVCADVATWTARFLGITW